MPASCLRSPLHSAHMVYAPRAPSTHCHHEPGCPSHFYPPHSLKLPSTMPHFNPSLNARVHLYDTAAAWRGCWTACRCEANTCQRPACHQPFAQFPSASNCRQVSPALWCGECIEAWCLYVGFCRQWQHSLAAALQHCWLLLACPVLPGKVCFLQHRVTGRRVNTSEK